jgi:acetyltransferase EpsM
MAIRRRVTTKLVGMGVQRFATLVHPSADCNRASLAPGAVIHYGCAIGADSVVGGQSIVSFGAIVAHESSLADHVFVSPGAILNGRVAVGSGAFVGAGAIVLPYKRVGEWSIVGAGAVVTEDVPAFSTVFGAPARVIAKRSSVTSEV